MKLWFTVGFLAILVALATVDAFVTVDESVYTSLLDKQLEPEEDQIVNSDEKQPEQMPSPSVEATGVRKQEGPKVETILGATGWEFQEMKEVIFLSKIIPPEESAVTGTVLLENKDRIGSIAWVESPKIKLYFIALKEALHSAFTPAVQDLVDETQRREGKPVRNLLTFLDTGINEERIVFVRVQDRLFEIHISEGKEDALFDLIDKLTE